MSQSSAMRTPRGSPGQVRRPIMLRHSDDINEGDNRVGQRTQLLLTCDVDVHGGEVEATDTVVFTVEGQAFECELCEAHLAEFRDAMDIWASHARPVGRAAASGGRPKRPARRAQPRSSAGTSTAEVREWARAKGLPVNTRGRVPAELHAAYAAAH